MSLLLLFLLVSSLAFGAYGMAQYRATRTENLPQHPIRHRILGLLRRAPGLTQSSLCDASGAKWGSIQYHLYLLERSGLVDSLAHGRQRHFFTGEWTPQDRQRIALLRRGRVRQLVEAIATNPGVHQTKLVAFTAISRKVMREYVALLEQEGLLEVHRDANRARYYPSELLDRYRRLGLEPADDDALPPNEPPLQET